MSRGTVAGAVLAAIGLLLVGCGSEMSGKPTSPEVSDAGRVDMCTILTGAELRGLGIKLDTRKLVDEFGVTGCQWVGEPFALRLERNVDTVADYVSRRHDPAFVTFTENEVNGRVGVQFSVTRAEPQCVQLMDGRSVSLAVGVAASSSLGPPVDACAEVLRIAKMFEPRLPKGRE